MVASGKAAQNGILIRNGESLENLGKIEVVIFDKTGTITVGKPQVVEFENLSEYDDDYVYSLINLLQSKGSHPISLAMSAYFVNRLGMNDEVTNFENVPGKGVKGEIRNLQIALGNSAMYTNKNLNKSDTLTEVFLFINGEVKAYIGLIDEVKKDSQNTIEKLKLNNIKTVMLTGDKKGAAIKVANEVGIDEVVWEVLPSQKAQVVKKYMTGKKVAMVGDGINDSPALAVSDVGIAIGSGADIAIESADVVLIRGDLTSVLNSINLGKQTLKNIKQNLFWAFIYNIIGIPFAAGVFYIFGGPLLNPMIGALAMSLSSVSVITNALRLRKVKLEEIK
jgi:Cu+-exporting ATPase